MQNKIIRIHAPRDALTLKALAELVVDVMEQRGAIPPRPTWEQKL